MLGPLLGQLQLLLRYLCFMFNSNNVLALACATSASNNANLLLGKFNAYVLEIYNYGITFSDALNKSVICTPQLSVEHIITFLRHF